MKEGTRSQFSPNRNCYINCKVSGNGELQYNIPYLREYVKDNWKDFTGRLIANGVSSEKEGSLLLYEKGVTDFSYVMTLTGNARVGSWNTTDTNMSLGGLSGTSGTYLGGAGGKNTRNVKTTWTIGSANTHETFAGKINNWSPGGSAYSGTVNIVKVGTGDWRLTGANDYKGTTKVNGGALIVNGNNSGTGAVSVAAEAVLKGKGTVAGKVTVAEGATVYAGDTLINNETLKLTGGCTVNAGGIVEIPLYSDGETARANKIKVGKQFEVNDAVLNLNLNEAEDIADDQVFTIFDLTGTTVSGTGFKTIQPETPSGTQHWDTHELLVTGKIYVRNNKTSSVDGVKADSDKNAPKYDLSGRRTDDVSKGLYIQNGKKYVNK